MGDEIIFFGDNFHRDSDVKKADDPTTEPTTMDNSELLDYHQQKSDVESPTIVGEVHHISREHLDFELGLVSPAKKLTNFDTPPSTPCPTALYPHGTPTPDSPGTCTPHSLSGELTSPQSPDQSPGVGGAAAAMPLSPQTPFSPNSTGALPPPRHQRCSRSLSSPPVVSPTLQRVSPPADAFVASSKSFTNMRRTAMQRNLTLHITGRGTPRRSLGKYKTFEMGRDFKVPEERDFSPKLGKSSVSQTLKKLKDKLFRFPNPDYKEEFYIRSDSVTQAKSNASAPIYYRFQYIKNDADSPQHKVSHGKSIRSQTARFRKIAVMMSRRTGGVSVKDRVRTNILKAQTWTYPNCFTGKGAIDWLIKFSKITKVKDREGAKALGTLLIAEGLIESAKSRVKSASMRLKASDDYLMFSPKMNTSRGLLNLSPRESDPSKFHDGKTLYRFLIGDHKSQLGTPVRETGRRGSLVTPKNPFAAIKNPFAPMINHMKSKSHRSQSVTSIHQSPNSFRKITDRLNLTVPDMPPKPQLSKQLSKAGASVHDWDMCRANKYYQHQYITQTAFIKLWNGYGRRAGGHELFECDDEKAITFKEFRIIVRVHAESIRIPKERWFRHSIVNPHEVQNEEELVVFLKEKLKDDKTKSKLLGILNAKVKPQSDLKTAKEPFLAMLDTCGVDEHARKTCLHSIQECIFIPAQFSSDDREKFFQHLMTGQTVKSFAPDSIILDKGVKGRRFYIVASGCATIPGSSMTLPVGAFFGEMSLLRKTNVCARVLAGPKGCCCISIAAEFFSGFIESVPSFKALLRAKDKFIANLARTRKVNVSHGVKVETVPGVSYASTNRTDCTKLSISCETDTRGKMYNCYEVKAYLGKGQFGKVKRVTDIKSKEDFAIKIIKKPRKKFGASKFEKDPLASIYGEISVLRRITPHPNIVQLKEVINVKSEPKLYIVQELCERVVMEEKDLEKGINPLPCEMAWRVFRDVLNGLEHLHTHRIIHRDLKPDNILIAKDQGVVCAKLADFGLAMHLESSQELDDTEGSPVFMAPEVLGLTKAIRTYSGQLADMYSAGATLYALLFGRVPFEAPGYYRMCEQKQLPIEIPSFWKTKTIELKDLSQDDIEYKIFRWPQMVDLLHSLMHIKPDQRMMAGKAKNHPWVSNEGATPVPTVRYSTKKKK